MFKPVMLIYLWAVDARNLHYCHGNAILTIKLIKLILSVAMIKLWTFTIHPCSPLSISVHNDKKAW